MERLKKLSQESITVLVTMFVVVGSMLAVSINQGNKIDEVKDEVSNLSERVSVVETNLNFLLNIDTIKNDIIEELNKEN